MSDKIEQKKEVAAIVNSALKSGAFNRDVKINDLVDSLGHDIDQLAGYVVAWEKYVAVIASDDVTPEVSIKRR